VRCLNRKAEKGQIDEKELNLLYMNHSMKMPPLTIRFVLLATLLASTIPMAVGIGVSAYLNSVATVKLMWSDLADELVEDAREKTLRYVESGAAGLRLHRLMANEGALDLNDREQLLNVLFRCLRAQRHVTWCSYGGADGAYLAAYRTPDGSFRLTHREPNGSLRIQKDYRVTSDNERVLLHEKETAFDPRSRPWWKVGETAVEPTWSEPFLFASRRQPGVVLTLNQLDGQNKLQGIWLMEYELSHISSFLTKMRSLAQQRGGPLADANIYVVGKGGQVIGHRQGKTVEGKGDKATLLQADTHPDGELREAYKAASLLGLQERQRFVFEAEGRELLGMSAPFDSGDDPSWTILVTVPGDALLGPIRENNKTAALIAALVALVSVLFGLALSERFVRLLSAIAGDLDRIAKLDFSSNEPRKMSQIREIGDMISARNRMTGALGSFSKYVPADLVRELVAKGQEATLGGETKEITVYFSDIVGFTSIAEKLTPQQLVDALAGYLGEMSDIIAEEMGTVDKFIGDAIMAFWNAPQDVEHHATAACRAALKCQTRLGKLRAEWKVSGAPEIRARIGLNTRECLVGNIGAPARMNYTVMGDPVNIASRLEAQCKNYQVEILIGESTRRLAGGAIVARPVDKIAVKGKEQGVVVYELLAMSSSQDGEFRELERRSSDAFDLYLAGSFQEALYLFEKIVEERPDDHAMGQLLKRCQDYLSAPPQSWDGVLRLTSK